MKKLMIGAAVCAAVLGLKAEIASANIVGYSTVDTGSNPNITGGMCFKTVGVDGDNFILDDIVLSGSTYASDWIQFIDPATSICDPSKKATYYTKAESINDGSDGSDAGWYDSNDAYVGTTAYPVGTAFLASFLSQNVTVQFAGQVITTEYTVDCTGKPYAFVANVCPYDLEANDIKLEGSVYASDWIQFIDPATSICDPSKKITYYSHEASLADGSDGSDAGWYDSNDADAGTQKIEAGSGFLCSFLSTGVKVVFPAVQ